MNNDMDEMVDSLQSLAEELTEDINLELSKLNTSFDL